MGIRLAKIYNSSPPLAPNRILVTCRMAADKRPPSVRKPQSSAVASVPLQKASAQPKEAGPALHHRSLVRNLSPIRQSINVDSTGSAQEHFVIGQMHNAAPEAACNANACILTAACHCQTKTRS